MWIIHKSSALSLPCQIYMHPASTLSAICQPVLKTRVRDGWPWLTLLHALRSLGHILHWAARLSWVMMSDESSYSKDWANSFDGRLLITLWCTGMSCGNVLRGRHFQKNAEIFRICCACMRFVSLDEMFLDVLIDQRENFSFCLETEAFWWLFLTNCVKRKTL